MNAPDKKSWQQFERIIAAIEMATSRGAKVTWNENIEGRQFDVAIRFTNGPHQYLTLIECKDQKQPVAVEKVDAFATKARDAGANKAVLVSSSGFQSGCLAVAKRHGIDLFRLNERLKMPPGADQAPERTTLGAYDFIIHFMEARAPLPIPESNNRLDYLLSKGVINLRGAKESLKHMLDRTLSQISLPKEFEQPEAVKIPMMGALLEIPTLLEATPVRSLSFQLVKQRKRFLPPSGMDHHLMQKLNLSFEMFDCVREIQVTAIDALDIPIGFNTTFKPGSYYTNMLDQSYYCESIENDSVWIVLIEGYSHGNLIQVSMNAKLEVSKYYVEITDLPELLRLQKMYHRYCEVASPKPNKQL